MNYFVTRDEWGATARGATTASHPIGKTLGTTFHWEGPHMGTFNHDECAEHVRAIQRFHKDTRNWADIAYNFVVCPHGYTFEGRGVGVRSAANGTTQANEDWYAVCYLGGEGDLFTTEAKAGFLRTVQRLRHAGAGPGINGHRDHKATTCPGDVIYKWLQVADFSGITPRDKAKWQQKRDRVRDIAKSLKGSPIERAKELSRLLRQALNETRKK